MTAASLLLPSRSTDRSPSRWAHFPTTGFPGPAATDEEIVCVLPVYSICDHGLGLPFNLEEVVGTAMLDRALDYLPDPAGVRVLPPLSFSLIPYGPGLGGLDPETAHLILSEIGQSVKAAGFRKLLFWVGSPWNSELVDTASRDARIEADMQTFVIEFDGVGLPLHPAVGDRSAVQALGAHLLGISPAPPGEPVSAPAPADPTRPGDWAQSRAQIFDPTLDAPQLREESARRLASLLAEIVARAPLGQRNHRAIAPLSAPAPISSPHAGATAWRSRYLPGMDRAALTNLGGKAQGIVIIPIGAIEQHGPHLPVVVDAMLGEAAIAALGELLPESAPVWFGPAITFGKSNEHRSFPGTVSLSAKSLRRLIRALATDLRQLGFNHIALLNTHGGNSAVIDYTLREIQTELHLRVAHLRMPSTDELSPQENTWGFHAGEWETSLMLAIAPGLVDQSRAVCHYPAHLDDPGLLRPENASAIFSWQSSDIAPDGVMGDATAASAAKGARWFPDSLQRLATRILTLAS